jgi:hypothetical protein
MEDGMGEWMPIESAPEQVTILVADEWIENIAKGHRLGAWFGLGSLDDAFGEGLDFEPAWWLPWDYDKNPFKLPLPAPPTDTDTV